VIGTLGRLLYVYLLGGIPRFCATAVFAGDPQRLLLVDRLYLVFLLKSGL